MSHYEHAWDQMTPVSTNSSPDIGAIFLIFGLSSSECETWKKHSLSQWRQFRASEIRRNKTEYQKRFPNWAEGSKPDVEELISLLTSDSALAHWYASGDFYAEKMQREETSFVKMNGVTSSAAFIKLLQLSDPAGAEAFSKALNYYSKRVRDKKATLPCPLGKNGIAAGWQLVKIGKGGRGGSHLIQRVKRTTIEQIQANEDMRKSGDRTPDDDDQNARL